MSLDKTHAQLVDVVAKARDGRWQIMKHQLNIGRLAAVAATRLNDERRLLKGIACSDVNRIPAFITACTRKGMSATAMLAQLVKAGRVDGGYKVKSFTEEELEAVCYSVVLFGPASMRHIQETFDAPSADTAIRHLKAEWMKVDGKDNCKFEQSITQGDFVPSLRNNSTYRFQPSCNVNAHIPLTSPISSFLECVLIRSSTTVARVMTCIFQYSSNYQ